MAPAAATEGFAGALGGIVALVTTYPLITLTTRQQTRLREAAAAASATSASNELTAPHTPTSVSARLLDLCREVEVIFREEGWWRFFAGIRPALVATAASQFTYYTAAQAIRNELLKGQPSRKTLSVVNTAIVSSLAGWINVLINHPLWLVVTRMQVQRRTFLGVLKELRHDPSGPRRSFYRGLLPAMIMVVNPVVQFIFQEKLVQLLLQLRGSRRNFRASDLFLAGALAKLAATLATYPMNLVKSRLQVSGASTSGGAMGSQGARRMLRYSGTWDTIRQIFAQEGIAGFYRGIETKIVQSVLAAALLFMVRGKTVSFARFILDLYK